MKILTKKSAKKDSIFCHFFKKKKKQYFLVNFDRKMDYMTHFHSKDVYFYIHYIDSLQVTALDVFKKKLG